MLKSHYSSKLAPFFLIFFILNQNVFSQNSGKLFGSLKDNSNQFVEFATITLAKSSDSSKILAMSMTDSVGRFEFSNLTLSEYTIKISLIGYNSLSLKSTISALQPSINLGVINIHTDAKILSEVQIVGQKNIIEKIPEGFKINVASNITQAGGTATDLLKNTPTVSVDAEGAITLRGKSPLILINGRNSNLASADLIPASSIESIEVITSASAKYDANAESGIINIVLKKNKANGTNGAFALGDGFGAKFRTANSAVINHKTQKYNLAIAYDNRFAGRTRAIEANRLNYNSPDIYFLNQNRVDARMERLQNLKINFDYQWNKRNFISLEGIGNIKSQDNNETLQSIFRQINNQFVSANQRHSLELQRAKVAEFSMDFERKFTNPNQRLTANIATSIENGKENTLIDTKSLSQNLAQLDDFMYQRTHNYESGTISSLKIDYSQPLSDKAIFDIGYKGLFRKIQTDYQMADKINEVYQINTSSSNIFHFNEQVEALYGLVRNVSKEIHYEFGIRAEQVNNQGNTKTSELSFSNQYLKLFPTALLSYSLSNKSNWKISYGKRINRPGLGQLNPFVDITDALNPHSGNPFLKPEIIHALEVGYSREFNKIELNSSIFYRHSENTIRPFYQIIGDGIVLNKPMNIGVSKSYGLENVLSGTLFPKYNVNLSFTLLHIQMNATNIQTDASQMAFNYFGKLINSFDIAKKGKLQVIANYTSPTTTPQGTLIPIYFMDLGYQQKITKRNARLGITIVDLFNTLKSGVTLHSTSFDSKRVSKADTRAIMLTFAYSFNAAVKEKLMENKFSREW